VAHTGCVTKGTADSEPPRIGDVRLDPANGTQIFDGKEWIDIPNEPPDGGDPEIVIRG
jgi:hypothetical protein